jgi:hypothetical protein
MLTVAIASIRVLKINGFGDSDVIEVWEVDDIGRE